MNKLMEAKGIVKSYGNVQVVRDGTVEIYAGEFVSIVGRSGSGKSTLLYLLAGLEQADSGTIRYKDQQLSAYSEEELAVWRREHIGLVFQNYNLIPTLTALENVAFPLYPIKMSANARKQRAMEMLEQVGLAERANHRPHQLSGGEQQRVSIARSLVFRPSILFADEPTGNLDSATGDRIMDLFLQLREEHQLALFIVTHDVEKVAARSDRRIEMKDGRTFSHEAMEHAK
ncbi:peptide ABC transporter ATP-binding protein [Xylanibacillus composti]|uniref:Peptide ABC transporter ATP-binding protein n=1 Tax=Xylanibacillus composti TaxID=1572762 RepID=A0A8J4H2A5_9BACL|nr:ABC transporter ATP-binding protein [Xylanibacillus composti]GIQ69643.1 peptide ABC transporter ATP-binding protein [Xylanibacillus composti]